MQQVIENQDRHVGYPRGRAPARGLLRLAVLGSPEVFHDGTRLTFALRNAIALLRHLLADADSSTAEHNHLLTQRDLLGLDPQAPLWLDLQVVQQAYTQAQLVSTLPSAEQGARLFAQVQHALALVRGPFLD